MTEVMWVTGRYPWDGDPVGGIFFQTQARALAKLGVPLVVVTPTPASHGPLRAFDAMAAICGAPRVMHDDSVFVLRPRYLNMPGQPSWALPDRSVAAAVWRSRRQWDMANAIHGHYAVTGLAAWRIARRTGSPSS